MWLVPIQPGINYCVGPQNLESQMAQLHAVVSSVYSGNLCCNPTCIPHSAPPPVIFHGFGHACKWQMDNGFPVSSLSPCLIHVQGAARCPSSHTMSETHSGLSAACFSLFFLKTSSYSVKVQLHFHFLCCYAPILPTSGSHNSYSQL